MTCPCGSSDRAFCRCPSGCECGSDHQCPACGDDTPHEERYCSPECESEDREYAAPAPAPIFARCAEALGYEVTPGGGLAVRK